MAVTTTNEKLSEISADAIVVGVYADSAPNGPAEEFNRASSGLLARLIEAKEVSGKKCETVTLLSPPGIKARIALVVGLGPSDSLDRGVALRAASAAAKTLAGKERGRVGFFMPGEWPAETFESAV